MVFCSRRGETWAAPADLVAVSFDLKTSQSRLIGVAQTLDGYLSDGVDVFVADDDALYRMPMGDGAPVEIHPLSGSPSGVVVHAGEVWLQTKTREGTTRIIGAKMGSPTPFEEREIRTEGVVDGSLNVTADRAELIVWGEAPAILRWKRGTNEVVSIPLPKGADDARLLLDANATFAFIQKPRPREGYTILRIPSDSVESRVLLDKAVDASLVFIGRPDQDAGHLYYLSGVKADGCPIVAMPKAGGEPITLGVLNEGGSVWVDGNSLFVTGGAGGGIYRVRLR